MKPPLRLRSAGDGRAKHVVGTQFEQLFDDVDDLIKRVADTENPRSASSGARVTCLDGDRPGAHAKPVRSCMPAVPPIDDFEGPAGQIPGEALGMALLVGVGLGVIMSTQP